MEDLRDPKIIEKARKILEEYKLCNHCLGRMFARIGHGMSNYERGSILREVLALEEIPPEKCELCRGIFSRKSLEMYAEMVIEKTKDIEFESFLIGSRFDAEILMKEEEILNKFGSEYAESIKMEFNRELGKLISRLTGKKGKTKRPDVTIVVDTRFDYLEIIISPVYIYGRYKKLVRGIPQSRWLCPYCDGIGCEKCNYRGTLYETSVQELIGDVAKEFFDAEDHRLHAMGREDIDARMLGNGRPFVLELIKPKRRRVDLRVLEEEINKKANGKVEVKLIRYATYEDVLRIKSYNPKKRYRAVVTFEKAVPKEDLIKALETLSGTEINQWTPLRVLHRRGNLLRRRKIYEARLIEYKGQEAVIELYTDGGTYIKELINGDLGRTTPNLSDLLGVKAQVKELDVIEVDWRD
ncbi:MAG: tRNA pseudouridine(54/55) synthase Pus10 [Euryarchaeota archaeon]|nr:tRNA pseudouridine(54/55) synthase Pus10 [Euryarchaeota archaeon]